MMISFSEFFSVDFKKQTTIIWSIALPFFSIFVTLYLQFSSNDSRLLAKEFPIFEDFLISSNQYHLSCSNWTRHIPMVHLWRQPTSIPYWSILIFTDRWYVQKALWGYIVNNPFNVYPRGTNTILFRTSVEQGDIAGSTKWIDHSSLENIIILGTKNYFICVWLL